MDIQIEINGEPYTGKAYKAGNGIIIHLPGVQAPNAAPFESLFQAMPDGKMSGGFLEVGEWKAMKEPSRQEYPFETQVNFVVGPDSKVWALVCDSLDELPEIGDPLPQASSEEIARRILNEAEEAYGATSMAKERAACSGWPEPKLVPEMLFWIEDEASVQEEIAEEPAYARALRGVANELRALGFEPSPAPWAVSQARQ